MVLSIEDTLSPIQAIYRHLRYRLIRYNFQGFHGCILNTIQKRTSLPVK